MNVNRTPDERARAMATAAMLSDREQLVAEVFEVLELPDDDLRGAIMALAFVPSTVMHRFVDPGGITGQWGRLMIDHARVHASPIAAYTTLGSLGATASEPTEARAKKPSETFSQKRPPSLVFQTPPPVEPK